MVKNLIKHALVPPLRALAMGLLWPLEAVLRTRSDNSSAPACFVIGPPRSGTTLVYELLVHRFEFAYLSNLAHRLYRTPVAASWLGRATIRAWRGQFESQYGHIAGWGAPNEGGWVWDRWIHSTGSLDAGAADRMPRRLIARTVNGIARVLGAPFLNKNVMHSVQMRLLDHLLPGCLFIEVRRDPAANVRSIVRARERGRGPNRGEWWSVRPDGAEHHEGKGPIVEACFQIRGVRDAIEQAAREIGSHRLLTLEYGEVCADPRGALDSVHAFLASHGVDLRQRGEVPEKFQRHGDRPLDDESEAHMREALSRFFGRRQEAPTP